MKKSVLIACLIFGGVMVSSFAQAQEVEGVYCQFNVKKWEGSILEFLKKGSDCHVEVKTEWGTFEYDQPLVVDPREWNPLNLWSKLSD